MSAGRVEKPPSMTHSDVKATSVDLSTRELLGWMFTFLRPVRGMMVLACCLLILWTGTEVLGVRVTAKAVDQIQALHIGDSPAAGSLREWFGSDHPEAAMLRRTILLLAGLTLTMGLLRYLREVTESKVSMNMVFHIREAVYDKLQRAGFGFHDLMSTGELINRALSDLQNVRSFIQSSVLISLEIVLIVTGYLTILMLRSPWVAVLSLMPLPFWTLYVLRFSRRAQPALKAAMEAGDQNIAMITENIAGVHVVKAFATEELEIAKYGRSCDEFFRRVMRRIRLFANFAPVIRSIATVSHLTLFLVAGILIIRGQFNAGDVLMLGAAMGAILNRLQQVSVINDQYQNAVVSARRVYEILNAQSRVADQAEAKPLPDGPGCVEFQNVTFGYDPAHPVLHDVSLKVPGGKIVAIVGPTGAGKTTLTSLIARFYDPQAGKVLIDGTDVRDVALSSLRKQVAYVFQETFLFSDTVEANIAYSQPGCDDGSIEAAARLAQAHEFVEALPKGYDTMLGERGHTLSGGQRQRLAIARAIHANPRILVLDDATAAIDPETEHDIRQVLRMVMIDRTVFIIAHRISTVKQADLVVVLERGRITQLGTHDQLMEQEGHYRQIVEGQLYGGLKEDEEPGHMKRMAKLTPQRRP